MQMTLRIEVVTNRSACGRYHTVSRDFYLDPRRLCPELQAQPSRRPPPLCSLRTPAEPSRWVSEGVRSQSARREAYETHPPARNDSRPCERRAVRDMASPPGVLEWRHSKGSVVLQSQKMSLLYGKDGLKHQIREKATPEINGCICQHLSDS